MTRKVFADFTSFGKITLFTSIEKWTCTKHKSRKKRRNVVLNKNHFGVGEREDHSNNKGPLYRESLSA